MPIARFARAQRGSILINVAAGLSLMVAMLASIDIGFLYYYQREYQKAADLAALSGSRQLANGCAAAELAGSQTALANLENFDHDIPVIQAGNWVAGSAATFTVGCGTNTNAVRALVFGSIPTIFLGSRNLSASAVAVGLEPVAQLRIRSSVATLNGGLLNAVTGSLLGGSVNLSVASWQGLANADINLLSFLDALAIDLGLEVGNYEQVLGADVSVGQLLGVAADVIEQADATADVGVAVAGIENLIGLTLPGLTPLLRLGDLINVQTGTPTAGLDTSLNVLDLVQASVQLASTECAVCVAVPINLPGVAGVQVRAEIIEPPQLSAIGRPALAAADPLGPDRIFVRTAQVRALVSVDLPIAGSVLTNLQNLVNDSGLINSVTSVVNNLLSLNLVGLLSSLLPIPTERDIIDLRVLPTPRLDVNIDVGEGQAYVDDYACNAGKRLDVPTKTAAANIRIGSMGSSAADAASKVFSSSSAPTVAPIPLIDIGTYHARQTCLLLICSTTWRRADGSYTSDKSLAQRNAFSGGGIAIRVAELPVAGTNGMKVFSDPPTGGLPDLGQDPAWQSATSTNIVTGLSSAIGGLEIQFYPPTLSGQGLGNVLALVGSVANALISTLQGLIANVLGPLLDPLINFLLQALGLNLNQVDVGANMKCEGGGGTLVE